MPLAAGTRLGPYEITSPLGAGGMGEVYRARDARLNRDVALKVLPEIFAKDAERMARFEREAQVLASLNHANIAALYGLEESGGVRALVMELVEGPTLAERIAAGPVPLDEALPIARQIVEALEYAHERGIVHRDLKPANVKVTPEGAVKVLDFGLAKALDDDPGASDLRNSPTLSLAATRTGVILGTAAYMSPEQARGSAADRRADVWAFGAVLYEMLAGAPAFSGDTVSDVLASVLKFDPDWQRLPAGTPVAIRTLLERCLNKDRRQRLQAIGEARIVLETPEPQITTKTQRHEEKPGFSFVSWCLCGGIAVLVLALAAVLYFRETPPPQPVLRYSIPAPEKTAIHTFAISPDGHYLAIAAVGEGKRQLWVRALDAIQPQLLPGTEDAMYPFWSPDSRWIAFFAQGKLKKIAVNGGPAQTLCDAPNGRRGAWNRDGVIVFAPEGTRGSSLLRVPALGGVAAPVTKADGSALHRFPVFLPDGRRFLYLVSQAGEGKNGVHLASLDSQASQQVLADQSSVAWYQSDAAYILFVRENTLMAQPVEPKNLRPTGELFPVAEQVLFGPVQQHAPVAVSDTGVLVYQSGSGLVETQIAWYDRAGKELAKVGAPGRVTELALSPDEKTAAVPRYNAGGQNSDIWLHELARGAETRFTFHASTNYTPVWLPDGARLVFSSSRNAGTYDLYQKETTGAGQDEPLLQSPQWKFPTSCSRDGRFLLYSQVDPKTGSDLWVLPLQGERKPAPFLQTEFRESQGQFSPDGSWIAYASDESGRREVYVRPFPAGPGKWKVSLAGGQFPRWRRDGKEMFFLSPDRKLMASSVKAVSGPRRSFEAAAPQPLFDVRVPTVTPGFNQFPYEVAADGKRFLVVRSGAETSDTPLTVVVNWLAGVRR